MGQFPQTVRKLDECVLFQSYTSLDLILVNNNKICGNEQLSQIPGYLV